MRRRSARRCSPLLGPAPPLALWASPTGRALQTLAIAAEHLRVDWHQARTDERLSEMDMGEWSGRYYDEIAGPMAASSTADRPVHRPPARRRMV